MPQFLYSKYIQLPHDGEHIDVNGHTYCFGSKINEGNFGVVYKCEDEWDNNLAAKIVVPKDRTYEEVQQQWLEELKNLVELRHPNITYVYDAFEYRHTFYIIMERCLTPLSSLIGDAGFSNHLSLLPYIAREILQAIHFIHKNGYAHKDIHPGNVFISSTKDKIFQNSCVYIFKLGDLGITRLVSDMDIFNIILAQWMLPPEYLNPEYGVIGSQIDIYHTGLLLLNLLFNQVYEFTTKEILEGRPREIAETSPSPYGPIIAKALRRHVADRTQTALEFWRDIRTASMQNDPSARF